MGKDHNCKAVDKITIFGKKYLDPEDALEHIRSRKQNKNSV